MMINGSLPLIYKIAVGHLSWMACIHIKHYSKFKDFVHSNIDCNIDHYRKGYLLYTAGLSWMGFVK